MKNAIRLAVTTLVFVAQLATGGGLWIPANVASEPAVATAHASAVAVHTSAARSFVAAFPIAEAQFAMPRHASAKGDPA
jgi:hypothetical protein